MLRTTPPALTSLARDAAHRPPKGGILTATKGFCAMEKQKGNYI